MKGYLAQPSFDDTHYCSNNTMSHCTCIESFSMSLLGGFIEPIAAGARSPRARKRSSFAFSRSFGKNICVIKRLFLLRTSK